MRRSVDRRWARPLTVPTATIPRNTRLRMINSDYREGAEVARRRHAGAYCGDWDVEPRVAR